MSVPFFSLLGFNSNCCLFDVSDEDRARDLIVCDYLRRRRMPYTLSVFASESGCSTEDLNLDEGPLRSRIGRTLSLKLGSYTVP